MLTELQKADVRRHLGVPFAGLATSAMQAGIRTLFQSGQLEFYMNQLRIEEECMLTGNAFAMYRINGTVTAGQTITTTLNGTAFTYTVTSADAISVAPYASVATNISNQINGGATGIFAGSSQLITPNVGATGPSFGQVAMSNAATFTMTVSATGGLVVTSVYNGSFIPFPNVSVMNMDGTNSTLNGYISICNYLQVQTVLASPNLAILNAGGSSSTTFRPYEIKQRVQLYDYWREELGRVLSVGKEAWGFRGSSGAGPGGATI